MILVVHSCFNITKFNPSLLQIAESFRRFGVTDTTTDLLVIKLSTSPSITHESVKKDLDTMIEGTTVTFHDDVLARMTDVARVRKIYKLNTSSVLTVGREKRKEAAGTKLEVKELEAMILGLMALRGAN